MSLVLISCESINSHPIPGPSIYEVIRTVYLVIAKKIYNFKAMSLSPNILSLNCYVAYLELTR